VKRHAARTNRLDAYLAATDLEAVWFTDSGGIAWLTGGVCPEPSPTPGPSIAVGYDGERRLLTTARAATQLADRRPPDTPEAPPLGETMRLESFAWHADTLKTAIADRSPRPAAADIDIPDFEAVDSREFRQPLTADEVDRYRALGREAAAAVETVCRNLEPTDTEHEVAAAVEIALASREVETPVVLVGGTERSQSDARPVPTDAALGDRVVVSVTAARGGLHVSLSRTVAFDPPAWLTPRTRALSRVASTARMATRAAASSDDTPSAVDAEFATAGDVFKAIRRAYEAVGFAEAWRERPQGGATGYAPREWLARPTDETSVTTPMAYAWNLTAGGARCLDTTLLIDGSHELLTKTGQWPTHEAASVAVCGLPSVSKSHHTPIRR